MNKREKTIHMYMIALTKLYGALQWRQFIKVFNRYNTPKLTKKEIFDNDEYWVRNYKHYVLYSNLLTSVYADEDIIDEIYFSMKENTHYIPTEEEILYLSKPKNFCINTPHHDALFAQIKERLGQLIDDEKTLIKTYERAHKRFCLSASMGLTPNHAFSIMTELEFEDMEDDKLALLLDLLSAAWNNTRMWLSLGLTPNEMREKMPQREEREEEEYVKVREDNFPDLNNAFAVRFYKLWYDLLFFINRKHRIVPPFAKPVYGQGADDYVVFPVRDKLWEHPEYIDEYLESEGHKLSDSEREALVGWRTKFKKGMFVANEHMDNYSILQINSRSEEDEEEGEEVLYGVYGISSSIETVLRNRKLPLFIETTILPFEGKIVYDTFLKPMMVGFGPGLLEIFDEDYKELKKIKKPIMKL